MKIKLGKKVELDQNGKLTCVEGELTNHHHAWENPEDVDVHEAEITDDYGTRKTLLAIVKTDKLTPFSHYNAGKKDKFTLTEEHATLLVKAPKKGSVYEICTQREVNFEGNIVKVTD